MESTYKKYFADRYTQSREQQILDYLNQRGAPVPKVILNHADQGYLEMDHAGQSLAQWLATHGSNPGQAVDALAAALTALLAVSELGIWHLDIAPRNFLLQTASNGLVGRVLLIDFGNAVSDLFPLQKPLWMLPSPSQHPRLRQALVRDWQAFYQRHGLQQPQDWNIPFEVPLTHYRDDWSSGLQVQSAGAGYCVLAHGLGNMLADATRQWRQVPSKVLQLIEALPELEDESLAADRLQEMSRNLLAWAQVSRATPRPVAVAVAQELSGSAGHDVVQALPHLTSPAVPKHQESMADVPNAPINKVRVGLRRAWILALGGGALIAFGWILLDLIYQAAGTASAQGALRTTWLLLAGAGLAALGTAVCLAGFLLGKSRLAWLRAGIYANVLGQALVVLELWLLQMPASVLLLAAVCPVAAFIGASLSVSIDSRGDR
jgi:hypothetical protein